VKTCRTCRKPVEDLRHNCPFCGGENFMSEDAGGGAPAMLHAMRQQAEAARHVDRGAQLFLGACPAEAEVEFQKAVALNPFNATAHGNLGHLLLRQGHFAAAIPMLEKALELNPLLEGATAALDEAKSGLARSKKRK
jgi:tetratricopeptide (TPR) repeat protein